MNKVLENKFQSTINAIFPNKQSLPERIVVAVSGGGDSIALTFLLQKFCKKNNIELFAVTVDHQVRENSAKEAKFVSQLLQKHNINHTILESYLDNSPESNIEGILREVRYNLLINFCSEKKAKHLFVAHHGDDVAENFLIRLFRGSGIDGLASMDYVTDYKQINIVRPLLDFSKEELKQYLSAKKIAWVEDESNDDEVILRNKIRKFLSSLKDSDLINKRIALASKSILESRKIIENDMVEGASEILQFFDLGHFLLSLKNFCDLNKQKAQRYLAWILMEVSGNYYKPRLDNLENLYQWILSDKEHKARSFYGCIVEKYDDNNLIIYREKKAIKEVESLSNSISFDNRFLIDLPDYEGIKVETLNSVEFNKLIKDNENLKFLREVKNPLKKVFYTIPILKQGSKIISTPHINFGLKIKIKLNFRTPLKKLNESTTI